MISKSLKDLALNITEEQYRELPSLSYSTMARYEKGGFSVLPKLFEVQESDALTFGSMVDTLMTEGIDKFNEKFVVANFSLPTESVKAVVDILLEECFATNFDDVADANILDACNRAAYQPRWGEDTRIKKIREFGKEYYDAIKSIGSRKLVENEMYQDALATVGTLRNSSVTAAYFKKTDEDAGIEFIYQPKFMTTIDGLEVKGMMDLLVVNHELKKIIPIDLKTTSFYEYDFPKRFLENHYDIQSRLYYRILRKVMDSDDYFRDFTLANFRFVVINKDLRSPLIFTDENCGLYGDIELVFKSGRKAILRDPITIGKELKHYLDEDSKLPDGITLAGPNLIYERLQLL